MAILKINNIDLPEPQEYGFKEQDVHSSKSGRSAANGNAFIDVINHKVRLSPVWAPMTAHELSLMLATINNSGDTFSLTYIDPNTNAAVTKTFYKGDKSVSLIMWDKTNTNKRIWNKFSMNFIEV